MFGTLDTVLCAEDLDDVGWAVNVGDIDLGCRQVLKLFELRAALSKYVLVVFLRNAYLHVCLHHRVRNVYVRIHVCTHVRMYYACMYVCMHVCMYVGMYVCMYVDMNVHTCVHVWYFSQITG